MIDLSNYFCPNPNCKDHGVRGKGNITTSTRYVIGDTRAGR